MSEAAPARSVTLLGPQRLRPTVATALKELKIRGPVAVVTAGWQEREEEDGELREHLDVPSVNLRLYGRTLEVFADDPELAAALHDRQQLLRELQELYRLRLAHQLDAVRAVRLKNGARDLRDRAEDDAMASVRDLDAEHLDRLAEVHHEFEAAWRPYERDAVGRRRAAIADEIAGCSAVAVAGGHVALLVNRLRLYRLGSLLSGRRVIAWSAGAMALGERIVLFHDKPPQGPGYAEVLESGLGVFGGVQPFPHARRRLQLSDPGRVTLLSRRFAPEACVALDEGTRLEWRPDRGWRPRARARRLRLDGEVERIVVW